MASRKALLIAAASMAIVVVALLPVTARPDNHMVGDQKWWSGPNNHVVGDNYGWMLGVDYDHWATVNDGISVGDSLEFLYDPAAHNVVLVNEDDYNNCVVPNNAQMWNDGNDMFYLDVAGKFFFICGIGNHGSLGMKFAITAI